MPEPASEPANVSPRLRDWLMRAAAAGASDVHLIAGNPPVMRLHGCLTPLEDGALPPSEMQALVGSLCSEETLLQLETRKNIDFSLTLGHGSQSRRFRANLFVSGGHAGACLR